MARILAVETATDACSLALFDDGVVSELHRIAPRQHSQLIFAMLQELIPNDGRPRELDCIAYGCGPGSFTGLRIAASLAQGLAFSLQSPALAVSSLEAMAWAHRDTAAAMGACSIIAALDARLGQFYWAQYGFTGAGWSELEAPRLDPGAAVASRAGHESEARQHSLLVGDAVAVAQLPEILAGRHRLSLVEALPSARAVAELASQRLERAQTPGHGEILPLYLGGNAYWKTQEEQREKT